jgi:hypothetical protein
MANLLSAQQTAPQLHSFREEQLYLILYLHQVHSGTMSNQDVVLNPGLDNAFGLTAVNDWHIYDSLDPAKAKAVAWARGHHMQTDKNRSQQYFTTCNIVFGDKSWYVAIYGSQYFLSCCCAAILYMMRFCTYNTCIYVKP